jgi:hypothetical protein
MATACFTASRHVSLAACVGEKREVCCCMRGEQNKTEQEAAGEAKEDENPELPRSLPDLTSVSAKACSSLTHWWIWRSA